MNSYFNELSCVFCRIVCEMDPAHADSRPGPVQLCVGECRPELRARSAQLYSFVVMTAITPHCFQPFDNIMYISEMCYTQDETN